MTKLTLVLAHGPHKPDGDIEDRMILDLQLTSQGQIDLAGFESSPCPWMAERQLHGGPVRMMEVVRVDEGWALQSNNDLDDPVSLFEGHVFRPGELVRLRAPDGGESLYRIVASHTP